MNNIVFKLFTGKYSDATLKLQPDYDYSVGNLDNCDIYIDIADEMLELFSFKFSADSLHLNKLTTITVMNHNLVQDDASNLPILVKHNDIVLGIGETAQIDEMYQRYLQDDLTDFISDEMAEDTTNLDEFANIDLSSAPQEESIQKNIEVKPQQSENLWHAIKSKVVNYYEQIKNYFIRTKQENRGKFYKLIAIIVATVILLILMLFILIVTSNVSNQTDNSASNKNSDIQKVLLNLPPQFANIKLSSDRKTKGFNLSGVVYNESQLADLNKSLANYGAIHMDVLVFTRIQDNLMSMVAQADSLNNIKILYDQKDASIELSGIVKDIGNITNLQIMIDNQYPQIGQLDVSKVYSAQEITDGLNKIINQPQYKDQITTNINLADSKITIQGYLDSNDIMALQSQINDFASKYQNIFTITLNVKDAKSALPFTITQVYIGNPSYIVTSNNKMLFEDGQIGEFVVKKITTDKIVFGGKTNITLKTNELNNNSSTIATNQGRDVVLKDEIKKESDMIAQYRYQLSAFESIYLATNDPKLQAILQTQRNNIQQELTAREKEYKYYMEYINGKQ